MSFQERSNAKNDNFKINRPQSPNQPRSSLLINSSFSIGNDQKNPNKDLNNQVLKKVSQTIISLHSNLVPRTQNIEIYRDLSEQEQQMLKMVQDNQLIHTILAGVMAIDSCLKYIQKEETYVISSLMKGVTIFLGNYKKIEEEFLTLNGSKVSQNFLKFYDSLKLIISDIHKIPAAKMKKNQLEKHNDFISKSHLNNELVNSLNRQQNLLFSLLAQQNNSLRIKLKDLEKQISELQKQKVDILKEMRNLDSEKKKRDSENNLTETGSQSAKVIQEEILIRQLKDQIIQKNEMIMKMNDEFTVEMEKYEKIFKRLQEENKHLKKYNDLDTVYILEQLEYEVQSLRQEKRNNQNIINQIMNQMNCISWNRNEFDYNNQGFGKDLKSRFDNRFGNVPVSHSRVYQTARSRCPSVSPNQKQQNILNRYFSPNYDSRDNSRNIRHPIKTYQRRESQIKQDESPRFGNIQEQKRYEIKERMQRLNLRKQPIRMQMLQPRQYKQQSPMMRHSQTKINGIKMPAVMEKGLDINKLKQEMRRSKFISQEMAYM